MSENLTMSVSNNSTTFILHNEEEEEDFGDPCHEFEHSIIFFIILALAAGMTVVYGVLLGKRRVVFHGHDVLIVLLLSFAAIRFGPKVWGSLQVHGINHASQSGCKLIAYTEFGLRNVNAFLVCCIVLYAWAKVVWNIGNELDELIRRHFPWILLLLFTLEGVTGMTPAIFTDVDSSGTRCDFSAAGENAGPAAFLISQILLATVLPYVIPFLSLLYPLMVLSRRLLSMDEEEPFRETLRNLLMVAWAHILLTFPWALHALVMLPLLQGWNVDLDAVTVCMIDGLFRLLLELWYVVIPVVCVVGDLELRKGMPGAEALLGDN